MKFKSLMLGAAAAAAATTAQAADLPVAPEPVDYVRVCDAYGARFYYIPGTETCLRVGGRVRTQFIVNNVLNKNSNPGNWGARDSNGYNWRTQGYLYLRAYTATEYGTLHARTAISQRVQNGVETFDFGSTYIQWGGLTAGYLGSNFDIFTGQVFMGVVSRDWSDNTINQIAYTAAFGSGFSATIALEDGVERSSGTYGGSRVPDLVGALAYSGGWGSAQLSGALHQVYPATTFNNGTFASGSEDSLGWAVGAGVKFNLPMIANGGNIYFQGFYADGAVNYVGNNWGGTDFAVSTVTGNVEKNSAWSLSGGVFINATDTIGLALDGSYADYDNVGAAGDATRWAIDGSVQWEPVSGFVMGADIGYADTDWSGTTADTEALLFGVRMQRTF